MKRTMFLVFLITLLLAGQICQSGGGMKLSLKEIKQSADQELKRQGDDPAKLSAVYDENNSNWYIPSLIEEVEERPELKTKIEGHDYIVVLYSRKLPKGKRITGGATYIFVDRNTGEILLLLRGK